MLYTMTSTLEELQEEVVGELYTLTKDNLQDLCDFLKISGTIKGKSCLSLVTHILNHMESDEITELEDDGMSEWLILKDKVT